MAWPAPVTELNQFHSRNEVNSLPSKSQLIFQSRKKVFDEWCRTPNAEDRRPEIVSFNDFPFTQKPNSPEVSGHNESGLCPKSVLRSASRGIPRTCENGVENCLRFELPLFPGFSVDATRCPLHFVSGYRRTVLAQLDAISSSKCQVSWPRRIFSSTALISTRVVQSIIKLWCTFN